MKIDADALAGGEFLFPEKFTFYLAIVDRDILVQRSPGVNFDSFLATNAYRDIQVIQRDVRHTLDAHCYRITGMQQTARLAVAVQDGDGDDLGFAVTEGETI